ncbi:MAG: hypothetical protein QOH40_2975, partial [Arthrobacter pascens]|nr:hypothetical protein [Arthrobacter pascens]
MTTPLNIPTRLASATELPGS